MASFNRTLIALDLSATDKPILEFSALLASALEVSKCYFLHVIPDSTHPGHPDIEFTRLFNPDEPIDEKVRNGLLSEVQTIFGHLSNVETEVEVVEGQPFEKLNQWIKVKLIDLLIAGNKSVSGGSGITAKRVVRHSASNVLYVPEKAGNTIRRILVPVDFSARSAHALQTAIDIAHQLGRVTVSVVHIIPQPSAVFYDPAWEYNAFRKMLRESAVESFQRFFKASGIDETNLNVVLLEDDYNSVSKHIQKWADQNQTDLIVIGSKGHSALNNLLFGSVTEALLERCKEIPILVIR